MVVILKGYTYWFIKSIKMSMVNQVYVAEVLKKYLNMNVVLLK